MPSSDLLKARHDRWLSVTKPTGFTRWLRTNVIWQFFRFIALNLKMVRLISRGHH